jgi:hypothetical protein
LTASTVCSAAHAAVSPQAADCSAPWLLTASDPGVRVVSSSALVSLSSLSPARHVRALQRFSLAVRRVASPRPLPSRRFLLPIRGVSTVDDGWEGPVKAPYLSIGHPTWARPQGFPRPTSPLFKPASPLSQTRSSHGLRSPPRCSPVSLLAGEDLCSEHRDNRASPGILLLMTAPLTRTARVALTRRTTYIQTFLPSA